MSFFEEERAEGGVRLLAIPRATAGGAQLGLQGDQISEEFASAAIGLFGVCSLGCGGARQFSAPVFRR